LESDLAYSKNIREIALRLRKDGPSAEEISDIFDYLAKGKSKKIPNELKQIADNASIHFGLADWKQLKGSPPSAKTIRRWEAESKALSKQTNKVDNTKHQKKSLSRKKNDIKFGTQSDSPTQKPHIEVTTDPQGQEIISRDELMPKNEPDKTDVTNQSSDGSLQADSHPQTDDGNAEEPIIKYLNEDNLNKLFAGGPCLASPDNIDVITLQSWGVPGKKVGEILFEWRKWHRIERHDICQVFHDFCDDLTIRNIGYKPAKVTLDAAIWATEFHVEALIRDIEIGRKYRHWENSKNHDAFMKEIEEISKPNPVFAEKKRKHLEEVRQLLEILLSQIDSALSKQETFIKFEIEDTSFINQVGSSHSWEVSFDLWGYIHLRMQYDQLQGKFDQINTKELQDLKKKMLVALKKVHRTVRYALEKQTFRQGFCSECPNESDID
jgi:hypothetical protein